MVSTVSTRQVSERARQSHIRYPTTVDLSHESSPVHHVVGPPASARLTLIFRVRGQASLFLQEDWSPVGIMII
ncbi:hypothetical protein LZ554_000960 [Drepanopeziza brunnea f. sp. 'monogermtubi']|nr:hypothetical protein LZ554_000960 [Drepanopeziza brunnea f. sp. 'monogermtubi']